MPTIAKMECRSVEDYGWSRKFKFACVHNSGINIGDTPENISFTKATPNGEAWMTVDNRYVWDQFHPILPAEDHSSAVPATSHYVVFIDADKNCLEDVYAAIGTLE